MISCNPSGAYDPRIMWFASAGSDGSDLPIAARNAIKKAAGGNRILIVEDEILVAIDMRSLLESHGFIVVGIAVSAEQAVNVAAQERPNLILMDIRLEGPRDGIEAASEIRTRFDIPSLFLTANADARTRARASAARPIGFMAKPINEEGLLRALTSVTN